MRSEIIIQQYLPNNMEIISRIHKTPRKKRIIAELLENLKICSFREFSKVKIEASSSRECSFRSIMLSSTMSNFQDSLSSYQKNPDISAEILMKDSQNEQLSTKEEDTERQSLRPDAPKTGKSKKKEQKMKMLNDPTSLNYLNEYRNLCAHNIMKNIKEGFVRHIMTAIGSQKAEHLENIVDNKATYQQIKRKVKHLKSLQDNKAIKTICRHPITQIIFKDFLEHAEEEWLPSSKIKEKEQCLKMVHFLLKIIDQIEYIDVIENYSKK